MNTLNYWLGKLNRLQLFGHGIKEFKVADNGLCETYKITGVVEIDGVVYLEINTQEG